MERNLNNIYEMVRTNNRLPQTTCRWYDTNKGCVYYDGDFYRTGICVNPITEEVLWWLDEIPAKNISLTNEDYRSF